jgi:hypothetical protein
LRIWHNWNQWFFINSNNRTSLVIVSQSPWYLYTIQCCSPQCHFNLSTWERMIEWSSIVIYCVVVDHHGLKTCIALDKWTYQPVCSCMK